jgi:hypothetical protein
MTAVATWGWMSYIILFEIHLSERIEKIDLLRSNSKRFSKSQTDISEKHIDSIFRVKGFYWAGRHYVLEDWSLLSRRYSNLKSNKKLHY